LVIAGVSPSLAVRPLHLVFSVQFEGEPPSARAEK
jgi:hypothetical protein